MLNERLETVEEIGCIKSGLWTSQFHTLQVLMYLRTYHEHVDMFIYGVDGEGSCGVRGRRDHIRVGAHSDDVWCVTTCNN